jgi:hypothetical protein
MAKFQKASSNKKDFREALREALRQAVTAAGSIEPILEYFIERGQIRRSKFSRAEIRRRLKLASALPPNERDKLSTTSA